MHELENTIMTCIETLYQFIMARLISVLEKSTNAF